MSELYSFGLPEVIAGLIVVALCAYAITGGADFGGGVWDLLASGPRRAAQRALIEKAIGPIWEANHVWLILVVVLLFGAFSSVRDSLIVMLNLPFALIGGTLALYLWSTNFNISANSVGVPLIQKFMVSPPVRRTPFISRRTAICSEG